MEEFLKQFKDNLENRPEPAFDEKSWQKIEGQLGHPPRRPAGFAWWWAALPLLLLLLGSNAYLFSSLKETNNHIQTLSLQRDTIYEIKTVYLTDTIYQTRVIYEERKASFNRLYTAGSSLSGVAPPSGVSAIDIVAQDHEPFTTDASQVQDGAGSVPGLINVHEKDRPLPSSLRLHPLILLAQPDTKPGNDADSLLAAWKEEKDSRKKTIAQHIHNLKPDGYRVGATAGWVRPIDDDLDWEPGYSTGVEAGIEFSPRLSMWLNASYYRVKLSTEIMDDAIGIPPVTAPADDFIFVDAEAPQPALQYTAGMQYNFSTNENWKIIAGVGYGALSILPYEVTYEFENDAGTIEWMFERKVRRSELLTDFLLLRMGIERNLTGNWNWQLRTTYRAKLSDRQFRAADLLGIESGLFYSF